jgi:hypothetical protein
MGKIDKNPAEEISSIMEKELEGGVEVMEAESRDHEEIMAEIAQDAKLTAGYEFASKLNERWKKMLSNMTDKKLENLKIWLDEHTTYENGVVKAKPQYETFLGKM